MNYGYQSVATRVGYGVEVAIKIPSIASNPPIGVVMDEGRDILVKLEGLWGSVEGQGGVGREKEDG